MYNVSNELKNKLNSNSVTTTARLTFSNPKLVIDGNNLVSLKLKDCCYNEGRIIGTNIAKDVEVTIKNNNYDLQDKEFYLEIGILLDSGKYEYIPYGNFIIDTVEDTKSNNEYKITAMDYMIKLNENFVEFDAKEYPMTMKQFLQKFAKQYGIELVVQTLPNENLQIPTIPYFENMSGRTVLKNIAEVFGRFAKFNRENKLEFVLSKTVNEQISRNNMNSNLEIDKQYGEVNVVSILLSDDVIGENVTLRDEESIALYGENIIKIVGNEFLNTQEMRSAAIQAIFNELKGFKYIPTSFTYMAKPYLDCGDTILVQDMETDEYHESIVLNHSIEIAALRQSKMENLALTKVQVQQQYIPELEKRMGRTEFNVNKVDKKITLVVEEQTTQSNRITNVENETNTVASNLNTFINETYSNDISNLQDQIDGAIQFWNGEAIPTLNNYPANEWTTEEQRNNHRADIYTVIQDIDGEMKQGKSYRFDKVGTTWQWVELTDNELSAVQALANSKAKVYVTTPIVPYNVGDLWLKDKELYECIKSKDVSGSYSASDWSKATKYTDDTKANEVDEKLTTTNEKVATIELNLDSITTRVSSTETKVTTVENTANTAKSTADTAKNIVDSLEVGARNLLLNTKSFKGSNITYTDSAISQETYKGLTVRTVDLSTATSGNKSIAQFNNIYPEKLGAVYTLSFYARGSGENKLITYFHGYTGYLQVAKSEQSNGAVKNNSDGNALWTLTDTWQRYWVVYTLKNTGDISIPKQILFRLYYGGKAEICGVKLEKGNKATDWTPAPEDIENEIVTTNTKVASIETNLTSITSRVSETETGIKDIEQAIDTEDRFIKQTEVQIDSVDNILDAVEMYGELKQEGTPSPNSFSPISVVGDNINLFDGDIEIGNINSSGVNYEDNTQIRSKNFINVTPNTELIISNNKKPIQVNICEYDGELNFIKKTYLNAISFITTSQTYFLKFVCSPINEPKIKLDKGTVPTSYTNYNCGGIDYKVVGKNLIGVNNSVDLTGYGFTLSYDKTTGIYTFNGTSSDSGYIKLYDELEILSYTKINSKKRTMMYKGDYTLSYNYISGTKTAGNINVMIRDSNDTATTPKNSINKFDTQDLELQFNASEDYLTQKYIWFAKGITFTDFKFTMQLERGSILTEHEPYKEKNTTIELPENEFLAKIGDYEDYIDNKGLLNKYIGKVVLDGSENIIKADFGTNLYRISVDTVLNNSEHNKIKVKSSHFLSVSYTDRAVEKSNIIYLETKYINIRNTEFTTVEAFKSYLSEQYANGTPVEIYYVLAEPYNVEITAENRKKYLNLPTLEGENNISISASTSGTYKRNTEMNKVYAKQNYVDEKFAEQVITNDNITSRVSATETTISNQSSDISSLNESIGSVNSDINNLQGNVETVKTQYTELKETVESFNFDVVTQIQQQLEDGTVTSNQVKTTSVTIDQDGIKVAKSGSEMQSLFDNEGLYVNKGAIDKTETKNNTLTVDKDGVVTENLYVRTYLTAGYHRTEGFIENGEKRTGVFYQGGADE